VVCFGLAGHRLKFAGVGGTAHSDRNDDDPFLFLLCSALPRLLSCPRITIPQLSSTIRDHFNQSSPAAAGVLVQLCPCILNTLCCVCPTSGVFDPVNAAQQIRRVVL
jgi:hypothetical protein